MNDELLSVLRQIEGHLAIIAAYAAALHQERSGEKTHEIGAWVRGVTSQGDDCVYLYATHPGLQYRICTVYVERLHELPFDYTAGKLFDGEAAPTREGAAKRGYLMACQPFRVVLAPTGKTTDAGHPICRFARVLAAGPAQEPTSTQPALVHESPDPAQPTVEQDFGARRARRLQPDAATIIGRFVELAVKLGLENSQRGALLRAHAGDYAAAVAELEQRAGPTATADNGTGQPTASPNGQAQAVDYKQVPRPWPSGTVIAALRDAARIYADRGKGLEADDGKWGALCGVMAGNAAAFLKAVYGATSRRQCTPAQRLALVRWSGVARHQADGQWYLSDNAAQEFAMVVKWQHLEDGQQELPLEAPP